MNRYPAWKNALIAFVIAVGALGSRLGLVDRELESQIVMLAVVTATLCPTLFRVLAPPVRPAERRRSRASA